MAEDRLIIIKQGLGPDGGAGLATEIDRFRASSSASATALSAHTILTSAGVAIVTVGTSNQIRMKLENAQFRNQEPQSTLTLELRDGAITGNRLLGPFDVPPGQMVRFDAKEVFGRGATSSFLLQVLSGTVGANPVSNGAIAVIGFTVERLDQPE